MKIKTVTYAMLRQTKPYENDRAEVVVELHPGDTVDEAFALAKRECATALKPCGCTRTRSCQ